MSIQRTFTAWLIGMVAVVPAMAQPLAPADQNSNAGFSDSQGVDAYGEALLRGPVHEAFAEQYNQDPIDGLLVDRAPPPPVPEIPPEIRPEGENVEWLSGYWFWDDDRNDFLWVSGTWRVAPPGQRWLPGYWSEADGRHQWVAGSWVPVERQAIEYIAQSPPESLDLGPVGGAPSDNHFWIPGCWTWSENTYAWRPGFWSVGYSNWIWVPSRYLWTPRGYVFCNGYWDYPVAHRGTLFAPFYFSQPVYAQAGFFYTPRVSILASLLQSHLWVRPRYHHYYFGDFYGANYRSVGIIPWHSYHQGIGFRSQRYAFDPLFAHASVFNRAGGVSFFQQVNNQYNVYVNNIDRRPSRTYGEQRQQIGFDGGRGASVGDRSGRGPSRSDRFLGESIGDLAQREPSRFTRLSSDQLTRIRNESVDVPRLMSLRRENESPGRGRPVDTSAVERGGTASTAAIIDRLQLPPADRGRVSGASSDRSARDGRVWSARPDLGDARSERRSASELPGRTEGASDRSARQWPTRPPVGTGSSEPTRQLSQPQLGRPSMGLSQQGRPQLGRSDGQQESVLPRSGVPAVRPPSGGLSSPSLQSPSQSQPAPGRMGDLIRPPTSATGPSSMGPSPLDPRAGQAPGPVQRSGDGLVPSPSRGPFSSGAQPSTRPGFPGSGSLRSGAPSSDSLRPGFPGSGSLRSGAPSSDSMRSGFPGSGSMRSGAPSSGSMRSGFPGSGSMRSGAPSSGSMRSGLPGRSSAPAFSPRSSGSGRPTAGSAFGGNRGGNDGGGASGSSGRGRRN